MSKTYDWTFPLPRTHTGILQGNGTMGAMIWGGENVLRITLNRDDFWDRRGGVPWNEKMNFALIRKLLEAGDDSGLREIFTTAAPPPGQPVQPSLLPLGRIELVFEPGVFISGGTLHLESGDVVIHLIDAKKQPHEVRIHLLMHEPLLHVGLPAGLAAPQIRGISAWDYVGKYLESISFEKPIFFDEPEMSGWIQRRPVDVPLCVGYRAARESLVVALAYGERAQAAEVIDRAASIEDALAKSRQWWSDFWSHAPVVDIPNPDLSFLYHYGMYKFAGMTAPHGVAAGLQGPWLEEYQMLPWSSDYHFNINVQMCYQPAYQGNALPHLRPVLDMVWSWREKLREYAKKFVGIDDGYMLPHAVDDRCVIIGNFWTGTIDHGCTAWVGKMMFDYYQYGGGDEKFLGEIAFPFMVGAMRVYEMMIERQGEAFVLPVSVSPEYRGAQMNAWGRNASFQLACIHWLCESLQKAAKILGRESKSIWSEIAQKLPKACVGKVDGREQIQLWEGTPLEESHRHHSHLASLVPFDVIDVNDPAWKKIIAASIRHWIGMGMGMWSGWCMSWAASLHCHVGNADAAELTLQIWQQAFTNEGHGTLHDAVFPGISLMYRDFDATNEVMQMDAGMGATAAILDLLVHTRRGVHHILPGAPARWKDVRFKNIRTEGAFLVSASRAGGSLKTIAVLSERENKFRLHNPWPGDAVVTRAGGARENFTGDVFDISMSKGERLEIRPV